MSDDVDRWHVHIHFVDGTEEIATGDPDVDGEVLRVVQRDRSTVPPTILFEAGYPLRHVKWWWVDYEHEAIVDAARWSPDTEETPP